MFREYSIRSVFFHLLIYGVLLYADGVFRVHHPAFQKEAVTSHFDKPAFQIQSQVLPVQVPGKQQKEVRSSNVQVTGWIHSSTEVFEKKCAAVFAGYKIFSLNILVRFRKADLIFPFHYFW